MVRARHAGGGGARRWTAAGGVSALLLLGGAGGLYLTQQDADEGATRTAPVLSPTPSPPTPSGTAPPTASPSASASPSPSASQQTAARATALPRALLECGKAVRTAERTVAAAESGARNWGDHVRAYRELVDGDMSYRQADKLWNTTKKAGPDDQRRFRRVLKAYEPADDACRGVTRQAGRAHADLAAACARRGTAASAAVDRSRRVLDVWADHLEQMREREAQDLSDARARKLFRKAVRAAPGQLRDLDRARDRLADAPECDLPRA